MLEKIILLGITLIMAIMAHSLTFPPEPSSDATRDEVLIALTVWGEARGSTPQDQIAIARVIRNRVADPRFPNTVQGVVWQPYQFSCWNDNDPNRSKLPRVLELDPHAYNRALGIARMVLAEPAPDPQSKNRFLNYHAVTRDLAKHPNHWAHHGRGKTRIGGHYFYLDALAPSPSPSSPSA